MPDNRFVYLSNQWQNNESFKRQRGFTTSNEREEEDAEPKTIREFQKDRLRTSYAEFFTKQRVRNENRAIHFDANIDLIKISFYVTFNDDLKRKFFERYGLSSVEFSRFNKTVTFEVVSDITSQNFFRHVHTIINSPEGTGYVNQPFNLIALVMHFEFIDTRARWVSASLSGSLLTLISSANPIYTIQKNTLFRFLQERQLTFSYDQQAPDLIEVAVNDRNQLREIADNFDIVKAITSTRALRVRPGQYGELRRDYGFTVIVPEQLTIVGVIDTGVTRITPLQDILTNFSYDHTGNGAFWDESGHGTSVAGLVALGAEFYASTDEVYTAKARIAVIKALQFNNDNLNISRILADIRSARQTHNVRLFNLSLNISSAKEYNSTYSHFAYELDKLAHELDVLVFIAVGNIDPDYLGDALADPLHPDHKYPVFFYKPDSTSDGHRCENTNICEPAESLNNISVGALAGNLEQNDQSDVTPNALYPAYYTRKFHFDYSVNINSTPLRKNQRNKHLVKPDVVFDGGDLFVYEAGMEILRAHNHPEGGYFARTAGTSLATPLITSYAAQILNAYPELRTQTVKAILINAATFYKKDNLPAFRNSTEALLKNLVGFGKPQKEKLLNTEDNSILFLIEDVIAIGEIITIPINLPPYLKDAGNKLKFEITLCYSFLPVKDNHLNYLPLHISFNLIKSVDVQVAANAGQVVYGIKNSFRWSEDHFGLDNRLFSNSQSATYILQPRDISAADNAVALAVRCLLKNEIPEEYSRQAKRIAHRFSMVIRITEQQTQSVNNSLYQQILACNEIKNIAAATNEVDIDVDVDL
ncbi:S8 family peptidase [Chitinophaga ginsengisoli]|uniref:Subtilase family protein n=1 Tax=Chitinophaga ginsengisoli TaxID=363837 RepID=A0A2P8G0P8_9BACT|nr:S8 family peptidase [Chitinophaga ginsengisoli]PSL27546.1 subtilase family protein [Chitinophaga ginsengisoli]